MLTQLSNELESLRRDIYENGDRREGHLSEVKQALELEGGVHSPFILNIPELLSRQSSAAAIYPDEQEFECLDMESEQSVLHARLTNPSSTTKAAKPTKRSRDGSPYPYFPTGITKKIASNFARSRGSKLTIIGNETLEAITEATDQYFEQLSNDLGVFATHARRKKINESDVVAVMKR